MVEDPLAPEVLTCVGCGAQQPPSAFHREASRPRGRNRRGTECRNARNRERLAETIQPRRGQDRERYAAAVRALELRGCGLTPQGHDALVEGQGAGCALCGGPPGRTGGTSRAVDHRHEAGHVRGPLRCRRTVALGLLRDGPDLLRAAAEHLERTAPERRLTRPGRPTAAGAP